MRNRKGFSFRIFTAGVRKSIKRENQNVEKTKEPLDEYKEMELKYDSDPDGDIPREQTRIIFHKR